jgi:hypothetical protein
MTPLDSIKIAYERERSATGNTLPPWSGVNLDMCLAIIEVYFQGREDAFDAHISVLDREIALQTAAQAADDAIERAKEKARRV